MVETKQIKDEFIELKVHELLGTTLDFAVAQSLKHRFHVSNLPNGSFEILIAPTKEDGFFSGVFSPSTNSVQAESLIARENIKLKKKDNGEWHGTKNTSNEDASHWSKNRFISHAPRNRLSPKEQSVFVSYANDRLVAAMRCFVFSRLGNDILVPMKLLQSRDQKNPLKAIHLGK